MLPTRSQIPVPTQSMDPGVLSNGPSSQMDLPYAETGKVHLRFAPEPSGYLHIGHAKAALLNLLFAQQYQGRLSVRIDDTNPEKECSDYVDNVLKDVEMLGIKDVPITHTSDYFPLLMNAAEELVLAGKAYVDDTPKEQMEDQRGRGIQSNCRCNSVDDNLKLWREMIAGSDKGTHCCLRGKLDMQDPNKCLRDPVYYRCITKPHHRLGTQYNVYPTYDFCCPFVDAVEGITHALRSSEYHDRNAQYHRIQEDLGVRKVHIFEFSRLNMVYTVLSKRYLKWFVENGKVDGWDDPRLPTVQGIVRKGLTIEAVSKFIGAQGASNNQNLMEWNSLWSLNKRIIDPKCPRHTAVTEDGRVLLTLTNGPDKPYVRTILRHKKYEAAGEKTTTYTKRIWIDQADAKSVSLNEEITLMDWGNAIVKEVEKDQDGNVRQLTGVLYPEGSVKDTKLKLTWLPETNELVRLKLVWFDHLLVKKKLASKKKNEWMQKKTGGKNVDNDQEFLNAVNPKTILDEIAALGDPNMRQLKPGEVVQLERKGYFRCDVPYVSPSKPVILFSIPDGKEQKARKVEIKEIDAGIK